MVVLSLALLTEFSAVRAPGECTPSGRVHQEPAVLLAVIFAPCWAAHEGYTSQRSLCALGGEYTMQPRT